CHLVGRVLFDRCTRIHVAEGDADVHSNLLGFPFRLQQLEARTQAKPADFARRRVRGTRAHFRATTPPGPRGSYGSWCGDEAAGQNRRLRFEDAKIPSISRYLATVRRAILIPSRASSSSTMAWSLSGLTLSSS